MAGKYTQLFTNAAQTAAYIAYRPTYPAAIYTLIFKALGLQAGQKLPLAVDVATGSGQAILGIADRFDKIIGVDSSLEQIKEAPPLPNVSYLAGDAHQLPIDQGSADLVIVGQALHWFDRPIFYKSAAQALKKGSGVLAVMTYDAGHVQPSGCPIDKVYLDMMFGVLGPYWAAPRKLVDDNYVDMEPMAPTFFDKEERHEVPHTREVSLEELAGYVSSWSAYATMKKQHPEAEDPILAFRQRLVDAAKEQGVEPDAKLQLVTRNTLLLGVGPVHA